VEVYPGKDGEFSLYDDDGVSYDYEKGKSTLTKLRWNEGGGKLSASGGDSGLARSLPGLVKVIGKQ
jgi:alpha-D-xyloside xylohydrolase